jgi:hypothetical protein
MAVTFDTVLKGEGTASGIVVPAEKMAELGPAKRYPVVVTINDTYTYRNSVSWYKGAFMISVSSANKAAAGIAGGDRVTVSLEHDDAPRVLEIPAELGAALASAGVLQPLRALSYSRQRALVEPWIAAKSQEAKDRNLAKIVAAVS